ncbi:epimerase (plasmid) [Salinigranum rubrum]|uniref:Epimerase n=1 Tax=Salinigranum rubrum TaxID=755307 RepID=A0A2I8VQA1_9EURY|nr:NAD(P)-dependent oxidoreductase [Salinigranum rubrum]AUV84085.1 epimerase [Salinigranum rubrum]
MSQLSVFIAGATGVLGRRLVSQFAERGHTVVGLSRDERGDEIVEANGGEPHRADLFDEQSVVRAAEGSDVVIHAATAVPTENPTPEKWDVHHRVWTEGVEALTKAAAEAGADQYLQQSIVWVARQPDGESFDEESRVIPDPSTEAAIEAEEITREADSTYDFDVGILRCGYFYAPDAYHTRSVGEGLLQGEQSIIDGSENAKISRLHAHDAASAFVAVGESGRSGLWHVVDDEPVSPATFFTELADRLDAPTPGRMSDEEARQELGDVQVELFTRPMETSAEKLRSEVGWEPTYATYREGLDHVVETWRSEGYLLEAS